MTLENGSLCYSSEPIVPTNAHSQYSRKYEFDGITFICTNLNFGTAPAPYTAHEEHIFVLKDGKITHLAEWDTKNNLTKILSDGDGGYYLCSDSYSPTGASRWSNPFACVWKYTNNGEFLEVTIPDTNSINAIGTHGTKLYVKAMYYGSDKSLAINSEPPISAVNSGFYEIDTLSGNARRLYPYISGNCFLAENGILYCLADYASCPRVVNLRTGMIIPVG